MSGMRRLPTLLAAASVAAAIMVPARAAHATPTGCDAVTHDTYVEVTCTGGDGEVQAVAHCAYFMDPGVVFPRNEYGAWAPVGSTSRADCRNTAKLHGEAINVSYRTR